MLGVLLGAPLLGTTMDGSIGAYGTNFGLGGTIGNETWMIAARDSANHTALFCPYYTDCSMSGKIELYRFPNHDGYADGLWHGGVGDRMTPEVTGEISWTSGTFRFTPQTTNEFYWARFDLPLTVNGLFKWAGGGYTFTGAGRMNWMGSYGGEGVYFNMDGKWDGEATAHTPEPATFGLIGAGLVWLAVARRFVQGGGTRRPL